MRYIIVDLEATCWAEGNNPDKMEVIEIGAVALASETGPVAGEFASFVRPVASPQLSTFCRELTSIAQADVDQADPFLAVFPRFVEWMWAEPLVLCSWGAYDLNQMRRDCARHKTTLPPSFENHVNLKKGFAQVQGIKPTGMNGALALLNLPLEGTHHRGIDDARNIAKIAQIILPRLVGDERAIPLPEYVVATTEK